MNADTAEICIESENPFDGDSDTLRDIRITEREVANDYLRDAAIQELRREVERLTRECAALRAERDFLRLAKKNCQ